jgi:hypothetical protein
MASYDPSRIAVYGTTPTSEASKPCRQTGDGARRAVLQLPPPPGAASWRHRQAPPPLPGCSARLSTALRQRCCAGSAASFAITHLVQRPHAVCASYAQTRLHNVAVRHAHRQAGARRLKRVHHHGGSDACRTGRRAGEQAGRQAGRRSVVGEVRAPFGMEGTCTAIQHEQAGRLQCMGAPRGQPAPEVAAGKRCPFLQSTASGSCPAALQPEERAHPPGRLPAWPQGYRGCAARRHACGSSACRRARPHGGIMRQRPGKHCGPERLLPLKLNGSAVVGLCTAMSDH